MFVSEATWQVGDKKAKVKVQFNSSDQLFALLRDANFEQVGSIVKKRATFLKVGDGQQSPRLMLKPPE
eukprot:752607-Hanusia_phi.AAC.1